MPTIVTDARAVCARVREIGIPLVGESEQFLDLIKVVERVARHGDATVLIRGETGTGKELIARATHYLGNRANYPFVPVNCGALPESLAENELFGHRAGAFTGATASAAGLVQLAHRGTLFLDEVDALPPKAQVGLLRFLQDGHYRPLGAQREECADVRIIAACNGCLEGDVQAGRFREDLYYRLNLLSMEVPPLRARRGDVLVLSRYFLAECARRYHMPIKALDGETARWFNEYGWPGNVRELENLLHREYLLCDDVNLQIKQPRRLAGASTSAATVVSQHEAPLLSYRLAKSRAVEEFDRTYLSHLLAASGGNVTKAAQLAGKERRALGKLLKHYSLSHTDWHEDGATS